MSIVLKTIIVAPLMLVVCHFYVIALIAVGRRVNKAGVPIAVRSIAGTLVWLAFIPVLLAPFFWLILTEISPSENEGIWAAVTSTAPMLISYTVMIAPGLYYIFKIRLNELREYGYFRDAT